MKLKTIILAVFLSILISSLNVVAGRQENKIITYPEDDIDILIINADFGVADIIIRPVKMNEIFRADVSYDTKKIRIHDEYEKEGKTGYLDIGSEGRRKLDFDTEDNRWDIELSSMYDTELLIDLGACEADIELGDIPLKMIDMNLGAVEGSISFSKPNPAIADKITIDAGATDLEMKNLGNANFRRMKFDGGVGSFKLDFSGDYKLKSRVSISIGIGEATIYIPAGLPVRIDADEGFLSSLDFDNSGELEIDDGHCESDNFRDSEYGLDLEIDVGLGAIEIIWID